MFVQNGQIPASAVPTLDAGSGDKQVQIASETLGETMGKLTTLSDSITRGFFTGISLNGA